MTDHTTGNPTEDTMGASTTPTHSSPSMNPTPSPRPGKALSLPRALATLALAGLVLLSAGLPAQKKSKDAGSDRITTQKGKVIRRLEILKEGLQEIIYKKAGKESKIPTEDVQKIEWGDLPDSWERAEVAAEKGDWEKAASLYQETANSTSRKAFAAAAGFKALQALLKTSSGDSSKAEQAAAAAQSWITSNPDHREAPEAMEMLGKLHLLAAKPKEALAAFQALEAAVNSKNLPTTWLARARYGQGMALTDQGQFEKARQAFGSAAATLRGQDLSKHPVAQAIFVAAEVGKGETLMAENKYDEALQYFRGMEMSATGNPALKTAASCGRAAALVEIGIAGKDHKKLRTAQDQLAKVSATDLLDGDSSAKALYYLGKVIQALGKDEPDSSRRARRYFESVIKGYPDSPWALEAQRANK